jgi:hypothetical protein
MPDKVSQLTAAATTQVKLCPYDEEEPSIWFHLIEAQFAAVSIGSQKLRYANKLANLPKRVHDRVKACNNSEQPFDHLKTALLGQFGKSRWQFLVVASLAGYGWLQA